MQWFTLIFRESKAEYYKVLREEKLRQKLEEKKQIKEEYARGNVWSAIFLIIQV